MFTKKRQTFSRNHLKIPLDNDTHSTDITYCTANCCQLCLRRKFPVGIPYSRSDFTEQCKDYKGRITLCSH
jgi:hypothetical protein